MNNGHPIIQDLRITTKICHLLNSRSLMLGALLLGVTPTILTFPRSPFMNCAFIVRVTVLWNGKTIRRFHAKCAILMLDFVANAMELAKNSVQVIPVMFVKDLEKI
jgi:hypothetical protein